MSTPGRGGSQSARYKKANGSGKGLTDDKLGAAALAQLLVDVAAAEEEDVVLLDAVLIGVPLVRGGDEDEALADSEGVEGLEARRA